VRVGNERRTRFTTPAYEVDDTPRGAGVQHRLDEKQSTVGRLFAWFENNRISGRECGDNFPAWHGHREVPRGNDAAHPDRAAYGHVEFVRQLARDGVAEKTTRFGSRIVGRVDCLLDVPTGFLERFTHLTRHLERNLILTLSKKITEFAQDLSAPWGWKARPGLERGLGS